MNKPHHNRKKRIKERMSHPTIYRANSCYASKWGLPKLERHPMAIGFALNIQ